VEEESKDDLHPLVKGLTVLMVVGFTVYSIWATILAFRGGVLPIVGIRLPGGLISGLLWLFIADPILMTVGYWISMILIMPIQLLISWLRQ